MPAQAPVNRALARKPGRIAKRKRGNPVTPRVKQAIEFMIHEAGTLKAASEHVGLTYRALSMALRKPEVLEHYRAEMHVFRTSARAGNIRAALDIRDSEELKETPAGQKVRLEAAKFIEGEESGGKPGVHVHVGVAITPGYVIDLNPAREPQIAHLGADAAKPLIDQRPVPDGLSERAKQGQSGGAKA